MLKLFNTLTKKEEIFKPIIEGKVGLYACGPTVYNYAHLGNLRTYIFVDILRRTLQYQNYSVQEVMNITDIGHLQSDADNGDDKMTRALLREGKPLTLASMRQLADFYTDRFVEDLKKLNIEIPSEMPKASDHITEDIELISILEKKGFIYKTNDGVYFDTTKDKNYGRLGGVNSEETDQNRIKENTEKKNPRDFALWKFNSELGWESPWGHGFPGWHLECSVMSAKYLGQPFDIHTGGIDHIAIHHNNEIAQSQSAYYKPLANYWLHAEFLITNGLKISKSVGNTFYLHDLIEQRFSPLAFRFFVLQAHYRSPLNFNLESLDAAQTGLNRLYSLCSSLQKTSKQETQEMSQDTNSAIISKYQIEFEEALNNDLNTPMAIAVLWKMLRDESQTAVNRLSTALDMDRVLGLDFAKKIAELENIHENPSLKNIPLNVLDLAQERQEARQNNNFDLADEIRNKISELGYEIKDAPDGFDLKEI